MANQTTLNSVEEVIDDFRAGKVVIVVDDEDRENEGDFIVAAENKSKISLVPAFNSLALGSA